MRGIALGLVLAASSAAWAAQPFAPRLYEATTETGLPHLEENLRYANTRSTLCLGPRQLATAFPILQHDALKGCRLDQQRSEGGTFSFALHCAEGNETRGAALWQVDEGGLRGTLDVKLGGKNMTFYQRITAKPIGACTPGD